MSAFSYLKITTERKKHMAQFTNRASLTFNDTTINSNIAVGEIVEVLTATKTAVVDTYGRNDSLSYVISLVNSGESALGPLTVTDNLGEYTTASGSYVPLSYIEDSVLFFIDGVAQPTPTVTAESPLTLSGITLGAGSNAQIVYSARTNDFAPLGVDNTITNEVSVSGGGIGTPIVAQETVTAAAEPDLSINKSISPIPVADNGRLTYTFSIQNSGNTAALTTDNIVLTDDFNPILSNLVVTYNGTTWTEGVNYTYNEATGEFATVAGQIAVDAASYTTDPVSGAVIVTPGVSTLTVTGTV